MKIDAALFGIHRLFLDTAPVIYYVERHPQYFALVQPIFQRLSRGDFVVVTSPVTLAETLMFPLKNNNLQQQQIFVDVLTTAAFTHFVTIDSKDCGNGGAVAGEIFFEVTRCFAGCDSDTIWL